MTRHRMTISILLFLGTALALTALTALARGGTGAVSWWVIAGGGGPADGDDVSINDTLGQPVVGRSAGGNVFLTAGYWSGPVPESGYTCYLPVVLRVGP
jgi:hypothetical protein